MNSFKKCIYISSFLMCNCIVASASSNSQYSLLQTHHMNYLELDDKYLPLQTEFDDKHQSLQKNSEIEVSNSNTCLTPSEPGCNNMWQKEKDDENKERKLNYEQKKMRNNYR